MDSMKLWLFFLLTSMAWTSSFSACMGSTERAYFMVHLAYGNQLFYDDPIHFNCHQCSSDIMKVSNAAKELMSPEIVYQLLEALANRTQDECCQGFYGSKATEVLHESIDSEGVCFWGIIENSRMDVCPLPEPEVIEYPVGHSLMSLQQLLGNSNAFDNVSDILTFTNGVSIYLDDGELATTNVEPRKLRFIRGLRAFYHVFSIMAIGVIGLLGIFYLFVISVVIYVWANDHLENKFDSTGNDNFREIMRQIHAEKEFSKDKPKKQETATQTDEVIKPAIIETCSSEADVTMDDISQSHA